MDGNGRWARRAACRGRSGISSGAEAVRRTVEGGRELGVSLPDAVRLLLGELEAAARRGRRPDGPAAPVSAPGNGRAAQERRAHPLHRRPRDALAADIIDLIEQAEGTDRGKCGLTLVIALNYGGRAEIVRGARKIARRRRGRADRCRGRSTKAVFAGYLDTAGIPDPGSADPHQRRAAASATSCCGSRPMRSSFSSIVLWPDFDEDALIAAIQRVHQPRAALRRARTRLTRAIGAA